jgi:kynureninase
MTHPMAFTLDDALALDASDLLAPMRQFFDLPENLIYLDGNSLGALPRETSASVRSVIGDQWGRDLIASWNRHDWITLPERTGAMIAPLIGAGPDEVLAGDTTSINVFKLAVAALAAQPGRSTILSEPGNFPTDLYIAEGVSRLLPERRLRTECLEAIIDAIDEDTALVLLTHVHYKTARRHDMAAITAAAHAKGALVLWDLSHSAGAVPVDLGGCDADLAVGCGYKYLNGGPGAPGFLFVARRLQDRLHSPLPGWMGHAQPFAFEDDYAPAKGISRFRCGTPEVLGLTALQQGLALFGDVDRAALYAKGSALGALFIRLMEDRCADCVFDLISPREDDQRGSHISFAHPQAYGICQALIARGVIGDFRAPDVLRMGFAPLYTSFADVWGAVEAIRAVIDERAWDNAAYRVRRAVT